MFETETKRVPYGYIALVTVFVIGAVFSWIFAFRSQPADFPVACGIENVGKPLSSTALVGQEPAAPKDVPVRVFNANGESGQATELAETLRTLGFALDPVTPYGNDPIVTSQDMGCFGQLRFGANFNASAATLHPLFPCFELIADERTDPSVDIALGAGFRKLDTNGAISDTMNALNTGEHVDSETFENLTPRNCA